MGGLLALVWAMGRRKGSTMTTTPRPVENVRLSPHFYLREWLRSESVPAVESYQPSEQEIRHARTLAAKVLEPLRTFTGPIRISGGARPLPFLQEINAALRRKGYRPSNTSDHPYFNAADIQFPGKGLATYEEAWRLLQGFPDTRQVILYLRSQEEGPSIPTHIHVSAVVPGKPKLKGPTYAFVDLDGQATLV